jgi:hypothetical protein
MAIKTIATIGTTKVEFHGHLKMLDGKTESPYKFIVEKLGYCLGDAVYTFHASYTSAEAAIASALKFDASVDPARHADLLALYAAQEAEWQRISAMPEPAVKSSAPHCSSCGCETSYRDMQKFGDVATNYCGC